jgi:glycosyltransferase involved in cell wall biosynthesis
MMGEFQAKHLSHKAKKHYDIAIGFMEGWSDKYIAFCVEADKKIGWLHSTFKNLAEIPSLEWPWMEKVDNIVLVADNCTEDFKKDAPQFADKAVTIRNIVDSELLRKRGELADDSDPELLKFKNANCFKIVIVCRVAISTKGLDRIVNCAKRLNEAGRKFLWYIVGDGDELETLRKMISDNGLEDILVAIGNRMNPAPFIKEADVFCMPSRYEGKPMVITESMILGTPPVVTRYLSASEQIENGVEGVIVENGDDTIFDVLDKYIENPELLRPMKEYLLSHEYGNSSYMREIEDKFLNAGV